MSRTLGTVLAAGADVAAVAAVDAVDATIVIRVKKESPKRLRLRKNQWYRLNRWYRQGLKPPARYAPIVLPGESISKYRNRTPVVEPVVAAAEASVAPTENAAPTVIEDFVPSVEAHPVREVEYEETEEVVEAQAQQEEVVATAPEHHETHAAFVETVELEPPAVAVSDHDEVVEESSLEAPQSYDRVETSEHRTIEVGSETAESEDEHHEAQAASETATDFHQHSCTV